MLSLNDLKTTLKELGCCIIIPTYNNAGTLKKVIQDVQIYANQIIVINDGSTDKTSEILSSIPNIEIVSYLPNKGKGIALRTGFEYAYKKGYQYAITIDSDGQHFADDIPTFIEKIKEEPGSIIIGARNMDQASVPGKSSFGHKFSNFWFHFETGIKLPDTQSGFRLYPLAPLSKLNFYTTKYEFEIEVIVRAVWNDVPIHSVPIKVHYAPPGERVSHFRPFQDFSRVSVLNTVLVTLAILWHIPIRFLKSFKKKNFKQQLVDGLSNKNESNLRKSLSIALGVFIGITPIWGYQLVTAIALAHLLKLNKILSAFASNISIPPVIPFIVFSSLYLGSWVPNAQSVNIQVNLSWQFIQQNILQYVAGSFCLAAIASVTIGTISFLALNLFRKEAN